METYQKALALAEAQKNAAAAAMIRTAIQAAEKVPPVSGKASHLSFFPRSGNDNGPIFGAHLKTVGHEEYFLQS